MEPLLSSRTFSAVPDVSARLLRIHASAMSLMLPLVLGAPALSQTGGPPTTVADVQKLLALDGSSSSRFGLSTSVSGQTLVVGAPRHDSEIGAVYAFDRSGSTWTQADQLLGVFHGEQFGCDVALDGDTLAVCASSDEQGQNAGSVRIYARSAGTWNFQALLLANDGEAADFLGRVAICGDRVVAGAGGDDDANPSDPQADSGAAYVFLRSGTSWTQEAKLLASDASPGDYFGTFVAIDGDTIAVGATGDDAGSGPSQGSLYVFERVGTSWVERQKLLASDPGSSQRFGSAASLMGDNLLVGAANTLEGGAVDAFGRSGSVWSHQARIPNPTGLSNSAFGFSIQLDGSLALISAPGANIGGVPFAGTAHIYSRLGTSWVDTWHLEASMQLELADSLGFSVAMDGGDVFASAPCDDDLGVDAGAIYVFRPGLPVSYCTGKTNSLGCVPFMTSSGLPSVSTPEPFRVIGNDALPSEAGVLLYGFGKANLIFHGARLCIKPPVTRLLPVKKAKNTGPLPCSGTHARNFNARIQSGIDPSLTMGSVVRSQWLLRDPSDPTGFFGDGLTDGLQFTIQP